MMKQDNAFSGMKTDEPPANRPTEINDTVAEIRELYSYDMFEKAVSKDAADREQVKKWIADQRRSVEKLWLENQDSLTASWNNQEQPDVGIPCASVPIDELESLLLALDFAAYAGDGKLKKSFILTFNKRAGARPAWYTKPLIQMCRKAKTPFCTAEDIFNDLPDRACVPPINEIDDEDTEITILDINRRAKTLSLKTFRDFCTRHKILKNK